jgi:hypothetical protein
MSARETDSNVRIALAGIAATAAVGLAGAAVTFVVARENRESSTELARLALVYNKRTQAYVDGLEALHTLRAKALINNYLALPNAWGEVRAESGDLGSAHRGVWKFQSDRPIHQSRDRTRIL